MNDSESMMGPAGMNPMHVPLPDMGRQQVLLTILDTSEVLQTLEYTLRGYRRNVTTGGWEPRIVGYQEVKAERVVKDDAGIDAVEEYIERVPVISPLVNEEGVSRIMGFMELQVSKVTQASMLNMVEINRLAEETANWINDQIFLNWRAWQIKKHDWDTLFNVVDQTNYKVLKQAYEDGIKKLLRETQFVQENIHRMPDQKRGWGFMGRKQEG